MLFNSYLVAIYPRSTREKHAPLGGKCIQISAAFTAQKFL
ncbi:hypothetical protein CLOSTMETH_03189 [[Clostridium] methylpentosum DSM 5476]|uniref:Uncharacterized protein n=1 Tax=[Clostridium] methylpentosum DSM 5476 TaxID=537013 RepID=C0EHF2_9FIRM|nr:hypothetical protein CLOSTMETH_03189 [[Clostridium] methylpentosum DSM 5476]